MPTASPSPRRTPLGALARAATLVLGPALLLGAAATSAAASTDSTGAPPVTGAGCGDQDGVTVVVDIPGADDTDPGRLHVGCATEAVSTGTEALNDAGFTEERDDATMVCAIHGHPDPCPTEFEGVFWSYWHADADGTWEAYLEGSDTTTVEAGRVEGWRYADGSEGPRIEPAAAVATEATEATEDEAAQSDAPEGTGDDDGTPVWPWVAGAAVLLALVGLLARNRTRNTARDGTGTTEG